MKRENKKAVALKTDKEEEMLGEQVIKRFPQEKRRNSFEEIEEQKGKWRRKEKAEDDFDKILELEEVRKMEEKQVMDDVTILMRKVAEKLAEFAMDQSVDNFTRMGLEE